jgi:hypothetical protein
LAPPPVISLICSAAVSPAITVISAPSARAWAAESSGAHHIHGVRELHSIDIGPGREHVLAESAVLVRAVEPERGGV